MNAHDLAALRSIVASLPPEAAARTDQLRAATLDEIDDVDVARLERIWTIASRVGTQLVVEILRDAGVDHAEAITARWVSAFAAAGIGPTGGDQ